MSEKMGFKGQAFHTAREWNAAEARSLNVGNTTSDCLSVACQASMGTLWGGHHHPQGWSIGASGHPFTTPRASTRYPQGSDEPPQRLLPATPKASIHCPTALASRRWGLWLRGAFLHSLKRGQKPESECLSPRTFLPLAVFHLSPETQKLPNRHLLHPEFG